MNYNAIYKSQVNLQQFNNMQNDKLQPKQLEISSISEYNFPVENRFFYEGDKKNEQKTLRHEQAHGITNDLDLKNTFQQQQQQQQMNILHAIN